MLSDESLFDYFHSNFHLMYKHNYNLSELENMIPWERLTYITLLNQEKEKEANKRNGR